MKIAFLKSGVGRAAGGLEKYTHRLMEAFIAKGHEVTFLTTGPTPSLAGLRSIPLAPKTRTSLQELIRFEKLAAQWLEKEPHRIIFGVSRTRLQTHYRAGSGVHAMYLQRRRMSDSFWKRATTFLNPLHSLLLVKEKQSFEDSRLERLFTNSHMVKEEILTHYRVSSDKIEVVHNGVEWRQWQRPFEETFSTRKERSSFRLLFVGHGYRRKGLLFLLKGLELLKKEPFHLTIVGYESQMRFFQEWVERHGLKDKVSFSGPQSDLIPFYQAADALVIPSLYDPFANVTVEGLAMGLFVVSSCYNGAQEILTAVSGTLIEELTSAESMAASLQHAFKQPKSQERAHQIRQTIATLDFSQQLDQIVTKTLSHC